MSQNVVIKFIGAGSSSVSATVDLVGGNVTLTLPDCYFIADSADTVWSSETALPPQWRPTANESIDIITQKVKANPTEGSVFDTFGGLMDVSLTGIINVTMLGAAPEAGKACGWLQKSIVYAV